MAAWLPFESNHIRCPQSYRSAAHPPIAQLFTRDSARTEKAFAEGQPSVRRRHILLGQRRTLAKEELFHLLHEELLGLWRPGLQAILVQQHLLAVHPLAPCSLRHVLKDLLAELRVE